MFCGIKVLHVFETMHTDYLTAGFDTFVGIMKLPCYPFYVLRLVAQLLHSYHC